MDKIAHSKMQTCRGFTLVEMLLGMMLVAVMVLIFAGSMVMGEKTAHVNGQYAQAMSLCQHKIDQLRAVGYGRLNYTELEDAGIIDSTPTSSPFGFTTVDEVALYLPDPTTSLAITSVGSNTTQVTVSITWKKARHLNETCTVTLRALITNVD